MKLKRIIILVIFISCVLVLNEKNRAKEIDVIQNNSILQKIKNETNFVLEENKLLLPCIGILTSKFGYRDSSNPIVSKNHKGIDIAAPKGTMIVASHEGVVLKAEALGNYGKCIVLQNEEYITLYAHCSKILVQKGEKVEKGEKIAEVGMTRKCYRKSSTF